MRTRTGRSRPPRGQAWALGDYHRFAKATVWEVGPVLVEACGISPGQRVLDVAAGTGNTAIRAAQAGADVVASDLTPENFEAGRREAEGARGRAGVGRGRRRGSSLRRRRVRRCHLFVRGDLRPQPSGGRRRDAARVPARGHDRNAQLHPRGPDLRVLRRARALHAPAATGSACRRRCGAARNTCGSCSATGSSSLEMTRRRVRRAGRQPARLPRALQADVRAGRRDLRQPRRRSRPRGCARPRLPGLRDALEQRSVRRGRGVPLRVPARGRTEGRRVGSGRQLGLLLSRESRSTALDEKRPLR